MKQYICTGTWRRHNKGDIISEFEYNKMPIEAKNHNYEEYFAKEVKDELVSPDIVPENIQEVEIQVGEFSKPPAPFHSKVKKFVAEDDK